jgi:hypothetical protein
LVFEFVFEGGVISLWKEGRVCGWETMRAAIASKGESGDETTEVGLMEWT